jgi:hypothetical protein
LRRQTVIRLSSLSPTWSGEPRRGEQIITQLQGFGTPIVSQAGPTPKMTTEISAE